MTPHLAGKGGILMLVLTGGLVNTSAVTYAQTPGSGDNADHMGIHAADPSVILTDDGYIGIESRGGRSLFVRVAPTLAGLAEARPVRIWSDNQGLGEVWAPEIVQRDGRYEIYFAAGLGSDHRMYVISSDQAAAGFGDAEEIVLPDDKWAIDGLPFTFGEKDYFIWSGWQGDTDVQQDIFIAPVSENGTVQPPRVKISSPDQPWENIAGDTPSINEGPQPIVDPAGQLHVVYSANGSWDEHYCLADLRLAKGADPLDAGEWFKTDGCLFGANAETLAPNATLAEESKGVGHHSFVLVSGEADEYAAESDTLPFLYHGVPAEDEPGNFWAARKWYEGTFQWVPDVAYKQGTRTDIGYGFRFGE